SLQKSTLVRVGVATRVQFHFWVQARFPRQILRALGLLAGQRWYGRAGTPPLEWPLPRSDLVSVHQRCAAARGGPRLGGAVVRDHRGQCQNGRTAVSQ